MKEIKNVSLLRFFQRWISQKSNQSNNQSMTMTKKQSLIESAPGVDFTNLLAQSANAPLSILQRCSVSPTKLRPTSLLRSTRIYSQLTRCTPTSAALTYLRKSCPQNVGEIDPSCTRSSKTILWKMHFQVQEEREKKYFWTRFFNR